MLERNHAVTRVVEPLGAVLDPKDGIFEVARSASISAGLTWGQRLDGTRNVRHR